MASEDQHELEGGLLILQKIKRGTLSEKLDLKTKKFQNYFRTENTDRWGELTHHEAEEWYIKSLYKRQIISYRLKKKQQTWKKEKEFQQSRGKKVYIG